MNSATLRFAVRGLVISAIASTMLPAHAAVSQDEAQKLMSILTPTGGERAGNKEGTIPEWKGGMTTPTPGFVNGGRRPDPFANERPLFSITAENVEKYKDKLTAGTRAMLAKHQQTFRLDVYESHRTAALQEGLYEKTFKNAGSTKVVSLPGGRDTLEGYGGGVPFPIPKTGVEAMWNHKLYVTPKNYRIKGNNYLLQADGKKILVSSYVNDFIRDVGAKSSQDRGGVIQFVRSHTSAPAMRSGEAILGWNLLDDSKTSTWVYLPGQRRVRRLPNSCCDTPTPFSSGLISFDEVEVYLGGLQKFDWKLVGKKEMYIPYNSNRTLLPSQDVAVLGSHHVSSEHVRWELHRVWVVEAKLKAGERHPAPKGTYYLDEDSWLAVLADRYDGNGALARTGFMLPIVLPDVPAVVAGTWGWYDLIGGSGYVSNLYNEQSEQYKIMDAYSPAGFEPDALAGEGVR